MSLLTFVLILPACTQSNEKAYNGNHESDPLPSWNDSASKRSIIKFVTDATQLESPDYIPKTDRIVVFDNDGTLWSEQPMYFQLLFGIDRVKAMAKDHPEWKTLQPFKAALEDDMETLMKSGVEGILTLTMVTHAGITTTEFEQNVKDWISTARHPKTGKLYKEMVYQPMLEVLNYLRANEFKTYIVSGGGIEFMRPWTHEVYGIPAEQVVGSSIKVEFEHKNGMPALTKLPEIGFINDKEGKPVGIHKFIGKRPVAAFGNSDGDLQMLQWTAAGKGLNLMVYIHHTDSEREWAYDRESHIGKLDKGLDEAVEKGWTVIDMKNDWKFIYPFDKL